VNYGKSASQAPAKVNTAAQMPLAAVIIGECRDDHREISARGKVDAEPTRPAAQLVQVDRIAAGVVGLRVDEGRGGAVESDPEVELLKGLAIGRAVLGLARELPQPVEIGIAVAQSRIDRVPDCLVAPIRAFGASKMIDRNDASTISPDATRFA